MRNTRKRYAKLDWEEVRAVFWYGFQDFVFNFYVLKQDPAEIRDIKRAAWAVDHLRSGDLLIETVPGGKIYYIEYTVDKDGKWTQAELFTLELKYKTKYIRKLLEWYEKTARSIY